MESANQIEIGNSTAAGSTSTQGSPSNGSTASSGAAQTLHASLNSGSSSGGSVNLNSISSHKIDNNTLAADIGAHGASSANQGILGVSKQGGGVADTLKKDSNGQTLSTTGAVVGGVAGAAAITGVVVSIVTTGAITSAGMGPFFWIGLIGTALAAGIGAIAAAVSSDNQNAAALRETKTKDQVAAMAKMNSNEAPNLLDQTLKVKADKAQGISTNGPQASSSGIATMDVAQSAPAPMAGASSMTAAPKAA